ncbi:hypothetical protein JOS77_24430 [Chromobacterium haemolyticum]|nr:hypothetical protein JOS77_24430 [Chromobacterium haemolyticum]
MVRAVAQRVAPELFKARRELVKIALLLGLRSNHDRAAYQLADLQPVILDPQRRHFADDARVQVQFGWRRFFGDEYEGALLEQ